MHGEYTPLYITDVWRGSKRKEIVERGHDKYAGSRFYECFVNQVTLRPQNIKWML
jgi:hypothetical protein